MTKKRDGSVARRRKRVASQPDAPENFGPGEELAVDVSSDHAAGYQATRAVEAPHANIVEMNVGMTFELPPQFEGEVSPESLMARMRRVAGHLEQ